MRKLIFSFIVLIATINYSFSQDINDKISDELCQCVEESEIKSMAEFEPCFETVILKNFSALLDFHDVKLIDDLDESVVEGIIAKFSKECDFVFELVEDTVLESIPKEKPVNALKCEDAKNGDFYYTQAVYIEDSSVVDTTYVTISGDMFLERMKGGKTYSLLDIIWKDDCSFDLSFVQSNDSFKKQLSKKGEIYSYEIVSATENSLFLKLTYKENEYHVELIKIETN